jgi:hypothetical protein
MRTMASSDGADIRCASCIVISRGDHAYHGVERRGLLGRSLTLGDEVDGFPFGAVAGQLGAGAPELGQPQYPPGNDHVQGDRWLETRAALEL